MVAAGAQVAQQLPGQQAQVAVALLARDGALDDEHRVTAVAAAGGEQAQLVEDAEPAAHLPDELRHVRDGDDERDRPAVLLQPQRSASSSRYARPSVC